MVLILINPCHDMSRVIVDTEKDEERSNCLFLLGDGNSVWTSNSSALFFSKFFHAHDVALLKP